MMSRVLWLLSLDDEKSTLGRTLETYGRTLPEWVWIPWIPQLLTSLTRRYLLPADAPTGVPVALMLFF